MATILIRIWVDSDGNSRVEADDCEAYNNLDGDLAVRGVALNVEVPEPKAMEAHDVVVPAQGASGEVKVTKAD